MIFQGMLKAGENPIELEVFEEPKVNISYFSMDDIILASLTEGTDPDDNTTDDPFNNDDWWDDTP